MKRIIKILAITIALLFIAKGLDTRLQTTHYAYYNAKIPNSFDGFTIVQLSDFHLKQFDSHQNSLIRAIKECAPDLIVFTGDVVDERHSDITPLKELLEGIYDLAPIYYVSGNHDLMPDALPMRLEMHQLFQAYGVINLDDQSETLERQGETILLTGLGWHSNNYASYLEPATQKKFNILFHHGSNYFPGLSQYGYDLILAGHIHGGIVRLPLLGGVFSNEGTLFPTYDAGLFLKNDCTMISSRGLGDARIPRFYNRPEIVSITLHP